jgi:hypothetical protein
MWKSAHATFSTNFLARFIFCTRFAFYQCTVIADCVQCLLRCPVIATATIYIKFNSGRPCVYDWLVFNIWTRIISFSVVFDSRRLIVAPAATDTIFIICIITARPHKKDPRILFISWRSQKSRFYPHELCLIGLQRLISIDNDMQSIYHSFL